VGFPRFLTAALLVSAWVAPGVSANSAGPEAAAAPPASPAPVSAPEASTVPAQPAAATHAEVPAVPAAAADPAAHASAPVAPAAAAAEAKPEAVAANDEDPIICRSQVETGTIGRKQKICMTKSQWEAQRQAARRFKRSVDQSRSTQPGGGG
jgi:hypothetical protein